MMKKWMAMMIAFLMMFSLGACGEAEETTVTGMVIAVDGTKISLMEMDMNNLGSKDFEKGEMPEDFQGLENINPEDFKGSMPDGEDFPKWEDGEMPDMPEGMTPPEGKERPEDGKMPEFFGENGGRMPGFGGFGEDVETKEMDIAKAHISVEIDGGKASGTMDDIQPGTFVTVTLNGKGEVTYVLVSSRSFFGGGRRNS